MARRQRDAGAIAFAQQRVEHVAGAVRVGKELAVRFLVQGDADVAKEGDRVGDRKRAQHAADDRRTAAPEITLGDDDVGDVAARAAADEDFRARALRAVEQHDRTALVEAADEDCRREAGGAGADDGDVSG